MKGGSGQGSLPEGSPGLTSLCQWSYLLLELPAPLSAELIFLLNPNFSTDFLFVNHKFWNRKHVVLGGAKQESDMCCFAGGGLEMEDPAQ